MRVFVTGITGFVGSSLAAHLRSRGHTVRGSTSSPAKISRDDVTPIRLGQAVDPTIFEGTDAVIHAAYDATPNSRRANVEGTIAIAEAAKQAQVARQLLISSYSAHAGAVTEYGLAKLELEAYFLSSGLAAIRPGLVIGHGGLYSRIAEIIRSRRIVPVICPRALVPVIGISDLTFSIGTIVEQSIDGLVRLYLDQRVTMLRLMRTIRTSLASSAIFMPLPYSVAYTALSLLKALRLPSPASVDNIRGLRANQLIHDPGDLYRFVPVPQELEVMVDAAR